MKINKKRFTLMLLLGLFVLIPLVVTLVEKKLEKDLAAALDDVQFAELDVSIIQNQISIKQASLLLEEFQLTAAELEIAGVNILALLTGNELKVRELRISGAKAVYFSDNNDTTETSAKLDQLISIDQLIVEDGLFRIESRGEDVLTLDIPLFSFEGVEVDSRSLETLIPFRYDQYYFKGDSLVAQLDSRHTLFLKEMELTDGNVVARNLQVVPKYDKSEFQEHIPHELDRYELSVPEIRMDSLEIGFFNDTLMLQNHLLEIDTPVLEVYRDKLQPDDPSKKLLYSAQLRNLPIILGFEQVAVNNSQIVYLENVHEDRDPIRVEFTDLAAVIRNFKNHPVEQDVLLDTQIEVQTAFMGEAPLEVDWVFNVADVSENFRISGSFNNLTSRGFNKILEPAMNIRAGGAISYLAIDFEGNDDRAHGEMQLRYDDFSVEVLKNDGSEKSGFLSAIANLFVSSSSNNDEVTHSGLEVERVKDKSFWNFLWLCIREGAVDSFL